MVDRVRAVYSGLLTHDMHYDAIINPDFDGPGSAADQLWNDLDLDVVGISAWLPVGDALPSTVMSFEDARAQYGRIINEHLVPLAARNPGRPITSVALSTRTIPDNSLLLNELQVISGC